MIASSSLMRCAKKFSSLTSIARSQVSRLHNSVFSKAANNSINQSSCSHSPSQSLSQNGINQILTRQIRKLSNSSLPSLNRVLKHSSNGILSTITNNRANLNTDAQSQPIRESNTTIISVNGNNSNSSNNNNNNINNNNNTRLESKVFDANKSARLQQIISKSNKQDGSSSSNLQSAILQNRFFLAPRLDDPGLYEDMTIEDVLDNQILENNHLTTKAKEEEELENINNQLNRKTSSEVAADAKLLFDAIFRELTDKYGMENLTFPKDVMWLAGAPGSGKGAMTKFISDQIGNINPPLTISEVLECPESEEFKTKGALVDDRIVLKELFEQLLRPQYRTGVIVDGFPRTPVQAECIKLLFDKMLYLRRQFENTQHFKHFRRPVFHVTVLYVGERVSVERQLKRGRKAAEHNRRVEQTGVGSQVEIRATDSNAKLARERYRNFYENMYASLQIVKEKFPFHFINAESTRQEVKASIVEELQYQSRNELADATFDNVRRIPLASEIKIAARHDLVRRLDTYERENHELFNKVIETINTEFSPIIKRQALSGQVVIRTENPAFFEDVAIDITLDVLSERGYRVVLDYQKDEIPSKIDPNTGDVINYKHKKILVFNISFPPPQIRHAVQKSTQWESSLV